MTSNSVVRSPPDLKPCPVRFGGHVFFASHAALLQRRVPENALTTSRCNSGASTSKLTCLVHMEKRPYQYLWGVWIRRFCFITSNVQNLNRIYRVFPTWGARALCKYPKHPKAMYWIGHCKPSKEPQPLNPFWRILI